jgi:betaine-aldehyde dehydrogenase
VVLDDADVATIAPHLLGAAFMNNGQTCAAQTRLLAPRSRFDEVVDAVGAAAAASIVGDPSDPETTVGPLVSARQRERVEGYIRSGIDEGARLVCGGGRPSGLDGGWYVEPTVFADVDNRMRIAREEIFGPVLSVIAYDGVDDAIRIANDSPYGLSGSVWGPDDVRCAAVAKRFRTGTVAVNSAMVGDIRNPFGGFKGSGIGREMGREGLEAYLETRTVILPPG